MAKYFYAVRTGNAPGIYNTWSECEREEIGRASCRERV